MYTIERSAGSLPGTLRRLVEGEECPTDGLDDYVEAFVTAVSNPAHREARGNPWLPPIDLLFETRGELVQFCKEHVIRLVVQGDVPGRSTLGHGRSALTPQGTGRIFNLLTAMAPRPLSVAVEVVDGIVGTESNLWVTEPLDRLLVAELEDEGSDIRRFSNRPIRRAFVYLDISDFSEFQPGQQVLMVTALGEIARRRDFWQRDPAGERALRDKEAMLCVGDGYVFVFQSSMHATYFAAHMASLIEILVAKHLIPVEVHFRMSVHVGPVYCFWDPGRCNWNYIGEAINGVQRVLSLIGRETDDVLFISSRVRQDLLAASGEEDLARLILSNAQNRGRRLDKHGLAWRTYEVNHTNLMSDDVRSLKWIAAES